MKFKQIVPSSIKSFLFLLGLIISVVFLPYCGGKQRGLDDDVIVRVNKEYLLRSDILGIFSDLQSNGDSAVLVQNFVEDWVARQVFLEQAKKNLSVPLSSFEKQVSQYHNALIVHAFENQLVYENLDTVITRAQLAEFFEKFKDSFRLKEDIVRARFAKFPVEISSGLNEFRQLIRSTNPKDFNQLEDYCINNSVAFYLDFNRWLSLSDLIRDLPVQNSDPENFLRNNVLAEFKDDYFKYFVFIFDHRKVGSVSPLSFEEDNIRNLILTQRKRELINKKRNQFLLEAKERNMVEFNENR